MSTSFDGLRPADRRDHVAWVVEAMAGRDGVDLVVPDCFESYVRIHHRIHNGDRWADFAPEYLVRGVDMYDYAGSKLEFIDGDGNLDAQDVDALVTLLRTATTTPNQCHYALWEGWSWVRPGSQYVWLSGDDTAEIRSLERAASDEVMAPIWTFAASCPVEPWWGGRNMILFDGALDAVSTIGHIDALDSSTERQCPQWCWPDDRAWFVGTEIDHALTYVAGDHVLTDEILATSQWEAIAVEPTDRW